MKKLQVTLIKSNNPSDPHVRCRDRGKREGLGTGGDDHGEREGLGTGGDAAVKEMRTCHECRKPWLTWPENREYVCVATVDGSK